MLGAEGRLLFNRCLYYFAYLFLVGLSYFDEVFDLRLLLATMFFRPTDRLASSPQVLLRFLVARLSELGQ